MLVDGIWLAAHAADPSVSVIEVDVSPAGYDSGHVPGAVLWNAYTDLRGSDYLPISDDELEHLLSRSGVTPDCTLVFYGYGGVLGFWLMTAYGHKDVRLLPGARDQLIDASESWSTDVPDPVASGYRLPAADTKLLAERAAVEAATSDPGTVVLDVRSEKEFSGEFFWPSGATADAGRAGHIPGAVSLPISLITEDGVPKPPDILRAQLAGAGVTPDKRIIVYCTIGNRASQAWFALKYLLDFPDVSVYYASWAEWGKLNDTPIES